MNIGELFVRLTGDTGDFTRKMTGAERALDSLGSSAQRLGDRLTIGVTAPLAAMAALSVRSAASMDAMTRGLQALTGDVAETSRQLERLREIAKLPGLGFREAVQGSINLQAVGFSADAAERSLRAFGNAIAISGGGAAELDRVFQQLTQMASAGRILTADLRPIIQISPLVARALKEAFGTISAEQIESMGLTFEEFYERLVSQLETLPQATGGAANGFENFAQALDDARVAIGEQLLPAITPLIEGMTRTLESVRSLNPETVRLWLGIAAGAAVLGPMTRAVGMLTSALVSLRVAGLAVLPVMGVGGLVIAGAALVSGWWVKNRLDALGAAGAVDHYRESLRGLSREQLLSEGLTIDARLTKLEALPQTEFVRGLIDDLYTRAGKVSEQLQGLGPATRSIVPPLQTAGGLLDGAASQARELKTTLEDMRWVPPALALPDLIPTINGFEIPPGALQAEIDRHAAREKLTAALDLEVREVRSVPAREVAESTAILSRLEGLAGPLIAVTTTAFSQLGGRVGALARDVGQVAGAFALGGPLVGGVAVAGLAFRTLAGVFDGGRRAMEQFIAAVKVARQSLDAQFGLLDIDSVSRQFELTLLKMQGLFGDNPLSKLMMEGLTIDNIQERVDKLLDPDNPLLNLDTTNERARAFIDFLMQLERLGDQADKASDAVGKMATSISNMPEIFDLALRRRQAAGGGSPPSVPEIFRAPRGQPGGIGGPTIIINHPPASMDVPAVVRAVKRGLIEDTRRGGTSEWSLALGAG